MGGIFNEETVMSEHGQFAIYKWSVRDSKENEEGEGEGEGEGAYNIVNTTQHLTVYHNTTHHKTLYRVTSWQIGQVSLLFSLMRSFIDVK